MCHTLFIYSIGIYLTGIDICNGQDASTHSMHMDMATMGHDMHHDNHAMNDTAHNIDDTAHHSDTGMNHTMHNDTHMHHNDTHMHHGHDMDGHNTDGHDMDGHNTDGHDMDGHNTDGHDMEGHDKEGHDGHDMDGSTGGHHGGPGGPFFYIGNEVQLIFENWKTNSDKELGLSVLYVVLVAVFFEGLKVFRDYITTVERRKSKSKSEWSYKVKKPSASSTCNCWQVFLHLFQTCLYMLHVFVSLCLMLVFMTFNTWLCIGVVGGAGLGYLIFGRLRSRGVEDDEEYCH